MFLHAQARLPDFFVSVLLLLPVVGGFYDDSLGMGFVPPFAEKSFELAQADNMTISQRGETHVGSQDWQCDPQKVSALGALIGVPVTVIPRAGHLLGSQYVRQLLDLWPQ